MWGFDYHKKQVLYILYRIYIGLLLSEKKLIFRKLMACLLENRIYKHQSNFGIFLY